MLISDTCLFQAIKKSQYALVLYIIETKRHRINEVDGKQYTPLMLASELGRLDIALELINAQAQLNRRDNRGRTALMIALSDIDNDLEIFAEQLNLPPTNNGLCSLAPHLRRNKTKIAKALVLAGADLNIIDLEGHTAFTLALERTYVENELLPTIYSKQILDQKFDHNQNTLSAITLDTQQNTFCVIESMIEEGLLPLKIANITRKQQRLVIKQILKTVDDFSHTQSNIEKSLKILEFFKKIGFLEKRFILRLIAQVKQLLCSLFSIPYQSNFKKIETLYNKYVWQRNMKAATMINKFAKGVIIRKLLAGKASSKNLSKAL